MKNGTFDFEGSSYFAPHIAVVGPVKTNERTMFVPALDERGRYKHHSCWQTDFCIRAWFDIRTDGQTTRIEHITPLPQPAERHVREELASLAWYSSHNRRRQVAEFATGTLGGGTVSMLLDRKRMQLEALRENFLTLHGKALKQVHMVILDYHDLYGGGVAA